MADFAVFVCRVLLLVINAAGLLNRRHPPALRRRRRLLHDDAVILMVLGASAIFHAVAGPGDDTDGSRALTAAAGFLIWLAGVALLLLELTPDRFPGAAARARARFAAQLMQAAAAVLF